MNLSPQLQKIIATAFDNARKLKHEFITPEHLLDASLNYSFVCDLLLVCGGNVDFIKENSNETGYSEEIENHLSNPEFEESQAFSGDRDQYFADAGRFIIEKERASIGMLQRVFKIGFNRAARIMDQLGEAGVVGPEEGTKPRKVMMTMEEFEEFLKNN